MKSGQDIAIQFPGLFIVHHNKPGQITAAHAHQEHHLIIPLKGEFNLRAREKKFCLSPGKMIYVTAQCEHQFLNSNSKEGERLICLIEPKLWKRQRAGQYTICETPTSQVCKELLFYLLLNPKSSAAKTLSATFVTLLSETLQAGAKLDAATSIAHILARARDERIKKAVAFLSSHYTSPQLKIDAVAKGAGLSARNLNRLSISELGLGPKEIIIRLRLEEAKRILSTEKTSVTEVSLRVGYQSLSRFIQSFRDTFGYLPSEVRAAL